jgi:hypothetical protein
MNKKGFTDVGILGAFIASVVFASVAGSPFVCDENGQASKGKQCLVGKGGKYAIQLYDVDSYGNRTPVKYASEIND